MSSWKESISKFFNFRRKRSPEPMLSTVMQRELSSSEIQRATMQRELSSSEIQRATMQRELSFSEIQRATMERELSFSEIQRATKHFHKDNVIKFQSDECVYKGVISVDGHQRQAVVKELTWNYAEVTEKMDILLRLNHPNLVSLIGYCLKDDILFVVYEHMEGGTLSDFLGKLNIFFSPSWDQRLQICIGAARGLQYLHNSFGSLTHGAVHTDNILLGEDLTAKVPYPGLFWTAQRSVFYTSEIKLGVYSAPEYLLYGEITKEGDVYSFGMVLLEMLCGKLPWHREFSQGGWEEDFYFWVKEKVDPAIKWTISSYSLKPFTNIVFQCLRFNPKERPDIDHVLKELEVVLELQRGNGNITEGRGEGEEGDGEEDKITLQVLELQRWNDNIVEAFPGGKGKERGEESDEGGAEDESNLGWSKTESNKDGEGGAEEMQESMKDDFNISIQQKYPRQFSLTEIQQATNNFGTSNLLGEGGEGKVYKGVIYIDTKMISIAVKVLKPSTSRFEQEITMLSELYHPNLVFLVGYCQESSERILVYEYMSNGSLANFLFQEKTLGPTLSWEQRLKICIDTARGLHYLHNDANVLSKRIIHRDVKPGNILLDENFTAKIADFGLLKMMRPNQSETMSNLKGSHGYFAPEYVMHRRVTRKIDVYSFGVVLCEVLCKKYPWTQSIYPGEEGRLASWLQENPDPDIAGTISPESLEQFAKIVIKCIKFDPEERPYMAEVVQGLEKISERHKDELDTGNGTKMGGAHPKIDAASKDIVIKMGMELVDSEDKFNLPGTEDRIVLYYTTLGKKKISQDCREVRSLLKGYGVVIDERDIALEPEFAKEFQILFKGKGLEVPRLFIRGQYIGGANEIKQIHTLRNLGELVEGFPERDPNWVCEDCADARFIPCPEEKCSKCSGYVVKDQLDCNEKCLIPCPTCCAWRFHHH